MMLSICTLPMSPAKNSSSVTAALINLRAGRRTSSLESLQKQGHGIQTCALQQPSYHPGVRCLLTGRNLLGRSCSHSPAAPCRPFPESALSEGCYLCLGGLGQKTHTHGEDKSLIPGKSEAAAYIPGLKSTMAFR